MKLFGGLLLLLIAVLLQFRFNSGLHVAPDFVLAILLTLAAVLSLGELTFFVILAVMALAWQPLPSWELIWFAAVPLIAAGLPRVLSLQPWIVHLLMMVTGIPLFYLGINWWIILQNPLLFTRLYLVGVLFGMVAFQIMELTFLGRKRVEEQ